MTEPQPMDASAGAVGYQGPAYYDRDADHLRTLSICWYVAAGLSALMGTFPLIHVALGLFMVLAPGSMGGSGPPPPAFVGWIFVILGSVFVILGWTLAILGIITARSLVRRGLLVVCYIAAALACVQVPIGTTLGVFTFVVLGRPAVKSSFS